MVAAAGLGGKLRRRLQAAVLAADATLSAVPAQALQQEQVVFQPALGQASAGKELPAPTVPVRRHILAGRVAAAAAVHQPPQ
jgi:hypothetical protein